MRRIAVVVAFAALAACNKGGSVHEQNASVEQVANAVRQSGVASDVLLHPVSDHNPPLLPHRHLRLPRPLEACGRDGDGLRSEGQEC